MLESTLLTDLLLLILALPACILGARLIHRQLHLHIVQVNQSLEVLVEPYNH